MSKVTAIGIDVGTTYCCVSVVEDGKPCIIKNTFGENTTSSYLSLFNKNSKLIGNSAKKNHIQNIPNTLYDVKRLIGRRSDDPIIAGDKKMLCYKIIEENSKLKISINIDDEEKQFFPEQLSGILLSYLRKTAENHLKTVVCDAVITVPAYFNNSQRQATKFAGEIAGLNVLRIVNEPTAAAIAYCFENINDEKKNILVYDLGGGTFDVSIIEIHGNNMRVIAVAGDKHLGGEDFNNNMVHHFAEDFLQKHKIDLKEDKRAITRLLNMCDGAKNYLSQENDANFELLNLCDKIDYYGNITRDKFEELNAKMFISTIEVIESCLKDAELKKEDIHEILMIGGSTRIPKIQSIVKDYFGENADIKNVMDPDEAVAKGAAILAAQIQGHSPELRHIHLTDVTSLTLGIKKSDGKMSRIIERNTQIPTTNDKTYISVKENQNKFLIEVYEGEDDLTVNNQLLGKFVLDGIKPAACGEAQHTLTFNIDSNGILTIRTKENNVDTDNSAEMIITQTELWSIDDIKRMIEETREYCKWDDV